MRLIEECVISDLKSLERLLFMKNDFFSKWLAVQSKVPNKPIYEIVYIFIKQYIKTVQNILCLYVK